MCDILEVEFDEAACREFPTFEVADIEYGTLGMTGRVLGCLFIIRGLFAITFSIWSEIAGGFPDLRNKSNTLFEVEKSLAFFLF